jgi:hypothetical protein
MLWTVLFYGCDAYRCLTKVCFGAPVVARCLYLGSARMAWQLCCMADAARKLDAVLLSNLVGPKSVRTPFQDQQRPQPLH